MSGTRAPSAARPEKHAIVLFGATGDLARRRLLPGLFRLAATGLTPDRYQIIGSARRGLTDEQFGEFARQAVAEFGIVSRMPNSPARPDHSGVGEAALADLDQARPVR